MSVTTAKVKETAARGLNAYRVQNRRDWTDANLKKAAMHFDAARKPAGDAVMSMARVCFI
jgi:hypothetical protein